MIYFLSIMCSIVCSLVPLTFLLQVETAGLVMSDICNEIFGVMEYNHDINHSLFPLQSGLKRHEY
jgi:hypothetical protein